MNKYCYNSTQFILGGRKRKPTAKAILKAQNRAKTWWGKYQKYVDEKREPEEWRSSTPRVRNVQSKTDGGVPEKEPEKIQTGADRGTRKVTNSTVNI